LGNGEPKPEAEPAAAGESSESGIAKPSSPGKGDKKDEVKLCASVIKGQECRNQKAGKPCPFSHEVPSYHKNIYICHLPLSFTKDDLEKIVTQYGKLNEVKILVDPRNNRSRGVGFVHFDRHEDAKAAINGVHNMKLPNHSQPLQARFAKISKKKEDGEEGGRGGPRRGGRGGRDRGSRRRSDYGPRRGRDYSPPRRGGPRRRDPYDDFDRYDDYYDDFDYRGGRGGSYPPPRGYDRYPPRGAPYDYPPYPAPGWR